MGYGLNAAIARLVTVFNPTENLLYDIVIPAVIMGSGSVLLAVSGIISENAAWWCFGIGALIHVLLLASAGFLMQGKEDGKHHGKSGK